jgi:hypothetical protein
VRQHVVGEKDVRHTTFCAQSLRELLREERVEGRYASLLRLLGGTVGGIDAQHRHAGFFEVAQQVAVIAGSLDHQAVGSEAARREEILSALLEVRHQRRRHRGEVGIVAAEEDLGVDGLRDLHQPATWTEDHFERNGDLFRASQLCFGEEPICKGRSAEVENGD